MRLSFALLKAQVLLDVYETQGEHELTQYRIPLLTWKESEELKAAYKLEALPGGSTGTY